jgi:hypothetical protein
MVSNADLQRSLDTVLSQLDQMCQELAVTNRTLHDEKTHTEQRFATMGDCIRQELHINATSLRQEMFDRFAELEARVPKSPTPVSGHTPTTHGEPLISTMLKSGRQGGNIRRRFRFHQT